MLIEVLTPRAMLNDTRREHLAAQLIEHVVHGDGTPADMIERPGSTTTVVIDDVATWRHGSGPVAVGGSNDDVIGRVTVPAGHNDDTMRAEMVRRIHDTLASIYSPRPINARVCRASASPTPRLPSSADVANRTTCCPSPRVLGLFAERLEDAASFATRL
jgi:hypothetical protein